MNDAKTIVKKYKRTYYASAIILGIITFAISLLKPLHNFTLMLLFLYFTVLIVIRNTLYRSRITSILTIRLDPQKYSAVIKEANFVSNHCLDIISAAYYNGDYQTVIDICTLKLKDKRVKRFVPYYLAHLGRVYFALNDKEKLALTVNSFEGYAHKRKDRDRLWNSFTVFKFYSLYLKNDFSSAVELYEGYLVQPKYTSTKWLELHTRFNYAIACYNGNELEKAKANFSYVVLTAPKLEFARLSQKYLNAIENGVDFIPESVSLTPDEGFTMPLAEKRLKKLRIVKIITMLALLLILINTVISPSIKKARFNSDVKAAVGEQFNNFTVVDTFKIEYDGKIISTACLCYTRDMGLTIGNLVVYDNDPDMHFEAAVVNISANTRYRFPDGYGQRTIVFTLYDSIAAVPDEAYKTQRVKIFDKTYYLCIENIYSHPQARQLS